MAPRKLKPYRVSYYFPSQADAEGKVRLYTRPVSALDCDSAKAEVEQLFENTDIVVHRSYLNYKPWKRSAKPTYIYLDETAAPVLTTDTTTGFTGTSLTATLTVGPISSSSTTPPWLQPFVSEFRYKGPVGPRPDGRCEFHPDAVLEADGRCPALDAGYKAPSPCEDSVTCGSSEHGQCDSCAGVPAQLDPAVNNPAEPIPGCGDPKCEICGPDPTNSGRSAYDLYRDHIAAENIPAPPPDREFGGSCGPMPLSVKIVLGLLAVLVAIGLVTLVVIH